MAKSLKISIFILIGFAVLVFTNFLIYRANESKKEENIEKQVEQEEVEKEEEKQQDDNTVYSTSVDENGIVILNQKNMELIFDDNVKIEFNGESGTFYPYSVTVKIDNQEINSLFNDEANKIFISSEYEHFGIFKQDELYFIFVYTENSYTKTGYVLIIDEEGIVVKELNDVDFSTNYIKTIFCYNDYSEELDSCYMISGNKLISTLTEDCIEAPLSDGYISLSTKNMFVNFDESLKVVFEGEESDLGYSTMEYTYIAKIFINDQEVSAGIFGNKDDPKIRGMLKIYKIDDLYILYSNGIVVPQCGGTYAIIINKEGHILKSLYNVTLTIDEKNKIFSYYETIECTSVMGFLPPIESYKIDGNNLINITEGDSQKIELNNLQEEVEINDFIKLKFIGSKTNDTYSDSYTYTLKTIINGKEIGENIFNDIIDKKIWSNNYNNSAFVVYNISDLYLLISYLDNNYFMIIIDKEGNILKEFNEVSIIEISEKNNYFIIDDDLFETYTINGSTITLKE